MLMKPFAILITILVVFCSKIALADQLNDQIITPLYEIPISVSHDQQYMLYSDKAFESLSPDSIDVDKDEQFIQKELESSANKLNFYSLIILLAVFALYMKSRKRSGSSYLKKAPRSKKKFSIKTN